MKKTLLHGLFPVVRAEVLRLLFTNRGQELYTRELARLSFVWPDQADRIREHRRGVATRALASLWVSPARALRARQLGWPPAEVQLECLKHSSNHVGASKNGENHRRTPLPPPQTVSSQIPFGPLSKIN